MKRCLAMVLPLIVLGFGCQTSRALKETIPASPVLGVQDERTEHIGEVIRETMRKEGIPGISVAVIDQGQLIWAQGFGWSDVDKHLPVTTDTRFQAGSISKPVSALGLLLLADAGKVALDEDVNSYLRGWYLRSKFTNNPVTLRNLLCHRAGMVPHGFLGFSESKPPPSLVEVMSKRYFMNGPVKVAHPPGSRYRYSGGGYCVVQKAMEDVTGESFETLMGKKLLEPLGMTRSHFHQPPKDEEIDSSARGYGWTKSVVRGGKWSVYPQMAAAGLWTTPQDLARLIMAVQKGNSGQATGPILPAIAREFLKSQFDDWLGMGVFLDGEGEHRGFFHGGENLGFFARFGAGVSTGRGWVIMSNAQKDRFDRISTAIAEEFEWE